jgi:solute carrier family 34 (sodium-dependent phosphate cotransporter)
MESTTPIADQSQASPAPVQWKIFFRNTAYILAALFIFLFALDLMISSLQHLGKTAAETIILATSNPFTALFIGLLITALIQSSSAVTSMVVALVASGSMTIESAVPIIMGANIGTTITSTIVSLGFISRKKEFMRAVSAGTYHSFFNILTAVILFPLEYYYGVLSRLSEYFASTFFNQPTGPVTTEFSILGNGFGPIVSFLVNFINNGFILAVLSIALLFGSILFFRKVLSKELGFASQDRFQRYVFKSPLKSFSWGLLTTAAVRSSSITTSLVVPLVAKKLVKLRSAAPFIMGANIGTTITAFIASAFNSNAAISIAIAHFLFNFIGVLFFFPIPFVRELPIKLAKGLGQLTLRYRLAGFVYLLLTFFFIPFTLIYANKDAMSVRELTYERNDGVHSKSTFVKIVAKTYENQQVSSWAMYDQLDTQRENPQAIFSVYRRKNIIFINNELYELNKPGFCRDGEEKKAKFQVCIREIIPHMNVNPGLSFDSVYVFERKFYPVAADSVSRWIYVSGKDNLILKKETHRPDGAVVFSETLYSVEDK